MISTRLCTITVRAGVWETLALFSRRVPILYYIRMHANIFMVTHRDITTVPMFTFQESQDINKSCGSKPTVLHTRQTKLKQGGNIYMQLGTGGGILKIERCVHEGAHNSESTQRQCERHPTESRRTNIASL